MSQDLAKHRLAWDDARIAVKHMRVFSNADEQSNWPETMNPEQLAALQDTHPHGEKTAQEIRKTRQRRIEQACQSGNLAHSMATEYRRLIGHEDPNPPMNFATASWDDIQGRQPARYTLKRIPHTLPHIAPHDFAEWLAAVGLEPSRHIAAWFRACGVTHAGQPQAAEQAQSKPAQPQPLKRKALIEKHRAQWPTIEDDLKEASRPGNEDLKAANLSYGFWDEDKALNWARSRGKLTGTGQANPLQSVWPTGKVHRVK